MVHSTISNKGNLTVASVVISFQVYDPIGDVEDETQCVLSDFKPGDSEVCMFNLTIVGAGRTLTISVPVTFAEGSDAKMGDNSLSEQTDVIAGDINAVIIPVSYTHLTLPTTD
mgnify:CR=1 FL=1